MNTPTAAAARGVDGAGAPYQRRALEALPLLVRQAAAGQTIYYSDLAAELGMPNERNLNYVLGAVGTSLAALGVQWDEEVPPLQALVVNRATGMPGSGFVQSLVDPQVLAALPGAPARARKQVIDGMLAAVFTYPKWSAALAALGASPPPADPVFSALLRQAGAPRPGAGGEGVGHLALKTFVSAHPAAVGVSGRVVKAEVEYALPSGDGIDVHFTLRGRVHAVEVKPADAPESDLVRGIFQCVKYDAVLNGLAAVEATPGARTDVRVTLALGGGLTPVARRIANTLGATVVEHVGV